MEKTPERQVNFKPSLPHGSCAPQGDRASRRVVERSGGSAPPRPPKDGGGDGSVRLSVRVEDTGQGVSIVALTGELDIGTIPKMEAPLFEQIRQRSVVVVDLSGLSFIDSSGIGILIAAFQESSGNQMRVVVGSGTQVDRVFRIAGVADALPVYHDRAAALVAMPNPENDQGDAGT